MTARQLWEGLLTELSKVNAPSMLLQDFNYFINKAINQYINKRYNIYDIDQQTADDLRVLKSTAVLKPEKFVNTSTITSDIEINELAEYGSGNSKLFDATYEVNLPLDYLHLLNCICIYKVKKRFKCYDKDNVIQFSAKRLTADTWSSIINNYYLRPLPERPYFYIHNVNRSTDLPTNPIQGKSDLDRNLEGTDVTEDVGLPRTISLKNFINNSLVEKEAGVRYGNPTNVRMEIRYGQDSSVFELIGVLVDYVKTPQTIRLTQAQINQTEDTSQILEFPDYVCWEIINELVHLVMETVGDPRLQTHSVVTQSIANPAQQQAPAQG